MLVSINLSLKFCYHQTVPVTPFSMKASGQI